MDLREFASKLRLKSMRDECGDVIIPGKYGQIYEWGPESFGCLVMAKSSRYWNAAREKLMAAGFRSLQNGDIEGTLLFNPQDFGQAGLAIKAVGAKRKRNLTEAQKAALVQRLRRSPQDAPTPDMRFISS